MSVIHREGNTISKDDLIPVVPLLVSARLLFLGSQAFKEVKF